MTPELARFIVVGGLSNSLLYAAYLVLTHFGVGPKTAMSLLFVVGVTQTFIANRSWTFRRSDAGWRAYVRYWLSYMAAYVLNLGLLALFVDRLGYPHQLVQAVLVIAIAVLLFALQKYWVFRETRAPEPSSAGAHVQ